MIREATLDDIPAMLGIGREFHAASHYADFGVRYSPLKMARTFVSQIQNKDARVLVAEHEGRVVGLACAVQTELYMSEDPVAVELYWWINEEFRGGTMGIRMHQDLERWATARGCKCMTMSSLAKIEDSPADAIYARRGYENMEKSWIRRL